VLLNKQIKLDQNFKNSFIREIIKVSRRLILCNVVDIGIFCIRATVVAKLLYACCALSGFITASDRKRFDAFLRRSKRYGFCPLDLEPFNDLIEVQEGQLFSAINLNLHHLLHPLLPPPSVACQNYDLRHRIQTVQDISRMLTVFSRMNTEYHSVIVTIYF